MFAAREGCPHTAEEASCAWRKGVNLNVAQLFFQDCPGMRRNAGAAALILALLAASVSRAQEPAPAGPAPEEFVPRLLASLDSEPLAVICAEDIRKLPERAEQTNLLKMLLDTSYSDAAQTLSFSITQALGADFRVVWPDMSRNLMGPAVLAILPPKGDASGAGGSGGALRLVLVALAPSEAQAGALRQLWPRLPANSETLLGVIKFQAVVPGALPEAGRVPAWAQGEGWPKGHLTLRASPKKLTETIKQIHAAGGGQELTELFPMLVELDGSAIQRAGWGVSVNGDAFSEEFQAELAEEDTAFTRLARAVRETPAAWDALMAALPGEQDMVVLSQLDLKPIHDDLPFAMQAAERFLRGKRFVRGKAQTPEALAKDRFKFLAGQLQGTIGLAGTPSLTGDMRLAVAVALKPGDVEAWRAQLVNGLKNAGAEFATPEKARKIGGTAPLYSAFQGRGLFSSPVIGLSPGWAWLCSSTAAYHDLTQAFKLGKTLKSDAEREKTAVKAQGHQNAPARADALRVQMNLERIVKLVYAAWLLSGDGGPFIGSWKVPQDLLPQPGLFTGKLGTLRARLASRGPVLNASAQCVLPGISVALVGLLQQAAAEIGRARQFARAAEIKGALDLRPIAPSGASGTENPEKQSGEVEH